MPDTPQDIAGLPEAMRSADYVCDRYFGLSATYQTWKSDIQTSINAANGKIVVRRPDGSSEIKLTIENIYHDSIKDAARSAAEREPTITLPTVGNRSEDMEKESLRRAIVDGYWAMDANTDGLAETLVADYLFGGAMFLLSTTISPGQAESWGLEYSDYPVHVRLNPRNCYPVFFRNRLLEFVHAEEIPWAYLEQTYPGMVPKTAAGAKGLVRVVDYWTPTTIRKVATGRSSMDDRRGGTWDLEMARNDIKRVPVAWAAEFGADDQFEIPFLQILGVMESNNTIAGSIMRHLDKSVYGEKFIKGEVDDSNAGPEGDIRGLSDDSAVAYVPPNPIAKETFAMFGANEQAIRGATAFPAQIQGGNLPSIISAAGITALGGQRAALVRYIQRRLAKVMREATDTDCLLDRTYLDKEKPLIFPVGNLKKYTPSKALDGAYRVEVTYAGMGFDPANAEIVAMEKFGLKLWPRQLVLKHDGQVRDPNEIERMIFTEEATRLAIEKFHAQADLPTALRFAVMLSEEGGDPIAAARKMLEAPEQIGQITPAGTPGPAPTPQTPGEETLALQKGALPGGEGAFPTLGPQPARPPLPNILVGNPK